MQTAIPLNRGELADRYSDPEWQEAMLDLFALSSLLTGTIIESTFKVSDDLNQAIILTEAGRRVRDQLITKEEVQAKDANLMCLVVLVHVEPLLDPERIDINQLVEALSKSTRTRQIRFPMIFGRDLYDRATTLFKEEKQELRHEDTLKLLNGSSQGVSHLGHFITGPFGILRVAHERTIAPSRDIPLQHCADLACHSVHKVELTTSQEPAVNRKRSSIHQVLDQISSDPSDWSGFVFDLMEARRNPYAENDRSTLPYLLGDGFSDEELRRLLQFARERTAGRIATVIRGLGASGDLDAWLAARSRAEALQILLTETDDQLAALMDDALVDGVLEIAAGEVRRPMVNHRARAGAWSMRSELSSLGYRSLSSNSSLALLRLAALARSLFDTTSAEEMDDLAWTLRDVRGDTAVDRLEEFLGEAEPAEILRKLVMSRRRNAERARAKLSVRHQESDERFLDVLLWKLGFPPRHREDIRDKYWRHHERLEGLAKTSDVIVGREEERLREVASNYFVALEEFLFDSLVFATWTLLNDHMASERPFQFYEASARRFTIQRLNEFTCDASGERRNDLTDEPTLGVIMQGFIRLSRLLESLRSEESTHLRSTSDIPKYAAKTSLQRFPFGHLIPYLDLIGPSQVRLIEVLRNIATDLGDSGVLTARNGLLHARRQRVPTVTEVGEALRRARSALAMLEEIGCVRTTYRIVRTEVDPWGRVASTLSEAHGRSLTFSSPSGYEFLTLPPLSRPLYLIQGAIFSPPNEVLRFTEGFDSEFERYWANFPVRPEPGNRTISNQTESVGPPIPTGAAS